MTEESGEDDNVRRSYAYVTCSQPCVGIDKPNLLL